MNEITLPQVDGQLATFSDEDFDLAAKGRGKTFMGSLKLFAPKSDAAGAGRIPGKHWGKVMGKDEITDLGEAVDVYVLAWRPKALDFSGKETIVSYDPKSEEFQRIKEASATFGNDCMCGIEFLVYLPSIKEFLRYWAVSGNAREDAKKLRPLVGGKANLSHRMREQGKFINCVPVTRPVEAPIGDPPSDAQLKEALEDFKNPNRSKEAEAAADSERPR